MKIRFLIVLCMAVMFVGCATHLPYIAPMQLSVPQQEIIDIIANMGQDLQREALAGYTYVHLIKARFLQRG